MLQLRRPAPSPAPSLRAEARPHRGPEAQPDRPVGDKLSSWPRAHLAHSAPAAEARREVARESNGTGADVLGRMFERVRSDVGRDLFGQPLHVEPVQSYFSAADEGVVGDLSCVVSIDDANG